MATNVSSGTGTHRRLNKNSKSVSHSSLFQIQFNSQKTAKTAQNKQYGIPSKPIEEWNVKLKAKETTGVPVFLGSDGTFYDINYVQVFKHKLPEKQSLSGTATPTGGSTTTSPVLTGTNTAEEDEETEESLQEQIVHLYNSIPQIDDYETFYDYEQAYLSWKYAVETIFLDTPTRLPLTTGRAYYRPKHVDFQTKIREASTFQDFSRPSVDMSDENKSDPLASEVEEDTMEYDPTLLKDLENSSDPWDALVVPQEPQPADYDTFEDYEEALVRWASICSQLSTFPPHATQLRELIPIQSISESQLSNASDDLDNKVVTEKESVQSSIPNVLIKSGIMEYEFLNNRIPTKYLAVPPVKEEVKFTQIQKDQLPKISDATRKAVGLVFASMESKRVANMQAHKSYMPPMIAKMHGTLPLPLLSAQKTSNMSFKNDALRRTDLSQKQIIDNYDCPAKVNGVPVEFKVPDHDIQFELNRLYTDPGYPSIIMNQVKNFHTSDRHNHLFSWHHPLVNEEHQSHKEEIDFIIMSHSKTSKDMLNIQNISDILYGDMYLDKFNDLLDTSFSEDFDGGKSYATVITKCITPDNIHQLLSLLECSNSPLFQAKMSYLIQNFFSGNKGSMILESMISSKDVKNLSLLTYSFDYLSEVPIELFPWSDETYSLVKQVLGDSNENLWKLIFCNYYLSVIGRVLDIHVHLYYSKPVITQSKVSLTHSIATLLQNNTPSILDKIFTGIRHRSQTVSSFCLFILLQLMHNQEGLAVSNCLKNDGVFLLDRIKRVCDSKLKHVQFAARRLFSVISKAPWVDFVYKELNKDPEATVRDFIGSDEKKPSNLLLELTLEFFISSLDRALEAAIASVPITNTSLAMSGGSGSSSSLSTSSSTTPPLSPVGSPPVGSAGSSNQPTITIGIKSKFSFVLDNCLFHSLLQHFFRHSKESTYQMYIITSMLSRLAKTHGTLGTISATQDVKSSQKKWGQAMLSLSPSDLRTIIGKISDPTPTSNPHTHLIKRNVLSIVRHVLKFNQVFEIIKKEEDFYTKLQSFCKDGAHAEFNKEAWCILYQICHNHIGTLDTYKEKILPTFFELIGTGSHTNVITNGLHYITKLFSMTTQPVPNNIDAKVQAKLKNDNKIIEKDVKSLNNLFIEKILFIKIHMIYRKFIITQPGLSFIELAKFYRTLHSNPNCHKLHKDIAKKTEYKEGLTKISNMYIDPYQEPNPMDTKPLKQDSFLSKVIKDNSSKDSKENSSKDEHTRETPKEKESTSASLKKTFSSFSSNIFSKDKDKK